MKLPDQPLDFDPIRLAAWSVLLGSLLALLVLGGALLVPLAVAILLWILIDAIRDNIIKNRFAAKLVSRSASTFFAILLLVIAIAIVINIFAGQMKELESVIPVYQQTLETLIASVAAYLAFDGVAPIMNLKDQLDLGALIQWLVGSLKILASDVILTAIYLCFLIAEEDLFREKLKRLSPDTEKAEYHARIANRIAHRVKSYLGMKTVVSFLTALICYFILNMVGVDFAALWSLLIFLLNFIPNIGSILGVIFPAATALLQFEDITPFLIVVAGLGSVQFLIGNIIEPTYLGKSLNLSSFMILISLAFWGKIWGLPGMFLSVPLTVILAITCSQIRGLQWFAILLSRDGELIADDDEVIKSDSNAGPHIEQTS